MEHLAPDIWTERVVAQGFPTVSAVIVTPARAFVVDTLTGPQRRAAGARPAAPEDARAAGGGGQHAPPLGPRVRQRRLPRRGHRRPPRLSPPHDRAAEHQPTTRSRPSRPRACPCRTSPSATASPTTCDPETVHLIHAPGHTADSIVVYAERAGVLVRRRRAGVAAAQLLRPRRGADLGADASASSSNCRWTSSCRRTGRRRPKSLIDANERYITEVYEAVAAAKQRRGRAPRPRPARGAVPRRRACAWTPSTRRCTRPT